MLTCVRGIPEVICRKSLLSLHTEVYRLGGVVFKIRRQQKSGVEAALAHHRHLKEVRRRFSFFTNYYGTVLAVEENTAKGPVTASFHEYVEPLSYNSIADVQGVFTIITQAQRRGFYLDLKPSNFGKKGREIFYLDDYGIGRTLVPPDVIEDLERLRRKFLESVGEL